MANESEFKDKWILVWFFGFFILFLPLGLGSTPATHGAYWREALGFGLMLSWAFTVLAGLIRPGGWVAIVGMFTIGRWLPHIHAQNLQVYFWIASYFTLFFSLGNRLTLGKMLIMAACSGLFMGFAYVVDPSVDSSDFFEGVLGWGLLSVILVAANALVRAALAPFRPKPSRLPDWQEDSI